MSKQEIANELKVLAEKMKEIGTLMDYFGGFDSEMAEHGAELVGAGCIAEQWAKEIEQEIAEESC